jgi:hypothetical protein
MITNLIQASSRKMIRRILGCFKLDFMNMCHRRITVWANCFVCLEWAFIFMKDSATYNMSKTISAWVVLPQLVHWCIALHSHNTRSHMKISHDNKTWGGWLMLLLPDAHVLIEED